MLGAYNATSSYSEVGLIKYFLKLRGSFNSRKFGIVAVLTAVNLVIKCVSSAPRLEVPQILSSMCRSLSASSSLVAGSY